MEIRIRKNGMAAHKKARLHTGHLGSQRRVLLPHIVREDIGLGVKVVQVRELPATALPGVAQGRHQEALVLQRAHYLGRSIGNVLSLAILNVVGVSTAIPPERLGLGATVRPEEGFPVLGDAEDDIRSCKCGIETLWVIELSCHHLRA